MKSRKVCFDLLVLRAWLCTDYSSSEGMHDNNSRKVGDVIGTPSKVDFYTFERLYGGAGFTSDRIIHNSKYKVPGGGDLDYTGEAEDMCSFLISAMRALKYEGCQLE